MTDEEIAREVEAECCPAGMSDQQQRVALAAARRARLDEAEQCDDVEVPYQDKCPLCKRENHPAMARRYRGYCCDACEAAAVANKVVDRICELKGQVNDE